MLPEPLTSNIDSTGVARYPLGNLPVMDPATGATLIDSEGRRSYTTSIAFGPTIGKNIALAYLPHAYAEVWPELQIQYFADVYPVKVEAVGYRSLYDPENIKPRSGDRGAWATQAGYRADRFAARPGQHAAAGLIDALGSFYGRLPVRRGVRVWAGFKSARIRATSSLASEVAK